MKLRFAMLLVTALAVTVGFTSCKSMGFDSNLQKIEATCASVSAGMKVLAYDQNINKLSADQRAAVIKALGITTPICTQENPPTLDDVKLQAFNAAAGVVLGAQARIGPPATD